MDTPCKVKCSINVGHYYYPEAFLCSCHTQKGRDGTGHSDGGWLVVHIPSRPCSWGQHTGSLKLRGFTPWKLQTLQNSSYSLFQPKVNDQTFANTLLGTREPQFQGQVRIGVPARLKVTAQWWEEVDTRSSLTWQSLPLSIPMTMH